MMDQDAVSLLRERFVLRADTYAVQGTDGGFFRQKSALTEHTIKRHLRGSVCVGLYPLLQNTCKWGCVDFDAEDKNPAGITEAVQAVLRQAARFGVELLPEFSGGKGWHTWIFTEAVEARLVRQVLWGLVRETGEEAFDGCTYPPEVNPKHDRTEAGKEFGNLVKLPWGRRADNGKRAQFVGREALESLSQEEQFEALAGIRVYKAAELERRVEENEWQDAIVEDREEGPRPLLSRETPYRGDLPCFEYVHDRKVGAVIPDGHRNRVLFAFTNHHKRKGSSQATAEDDILNLNRNRCRPPEDEDRVLKTVESSYKSTDSAACCESIQPAGLCPVLLHGVACPIFNAKERKRAERSEALNADAGRLTITPLYVMQTEPPIYVATVNGQQVQLGLKEMHYFANFVERCIAELGFVPELPYVVVTDPNGRKRQKSQQAIWLEIVAEALAARIFLPAPPEDASPRGIVWAEIRSFLTEGAVSENRDDLRKGMVVLDEVNGAESYLFRGRDLRQRFKLHRVDDLPMSQVWKLIADRGGRNEKVDMPTHGNVRVYILPASAVRSEGDGPSIPVAQSAAPSGLLN